MARLALERLHDFVKPTTSANRDWVGEKLARAANNGWDREAMLAYVRMIGDPLTVGCKV